MDPVLAQIYGTNSEASDLEKLASAQMAEELAEGGEEMDVDGASDDQIEAMAQAVLNDIQGDEQGEEETEQVEAASDDVDEETMAKVAEADKLGRVMAHSMWQELDLIKEAGKASQVAKSVHRFVRGVGQKLTPKKLEEMVTKGSQERYGKKLQSGKLKSVAESPNRAGHEPGARAHSGSAYRQGVQDKAKLHTAMGAGAMGAGAAAVGGGAYALTHKKKKHSSALETLAEVRALEILEANGIDPASLEPVQEKVAAEQVDPTQALQMAVEQGAWEILAQYGLEPAVDDQE